MADKKISALTASTTPLAGTEVLPIVQSGTTVKVSVTNLTAGRAVSASSLEALGNGDLITIKYASDGGSALLEWAKNDNTTLWTIGGGVVERQDELAFRRNSTNVLYLDNSNNVRVPTGNLVIATAGKGIDFSANTHAAGMTSELLNWYETGTWTATMTGSTAAPTTPVTATGYYTRIGNIVHVFAYFANVTTTGASGDLQVTGLPFAAGSARAFGTAALDKFTLTGVQAFAAVYNGDNKVIFSENVNGGYGPNVAIPSTTGVYAQFSITYQV